jgi:hypothetical protein
VSGSTPRRAIAAAALAVATAQAAHAQSYTAAGLHCTAFHESARSEIETETAGRVRRAIAERAGLWRFHARDTAAGVALEGWYDSLAVRHGTGDTLSAPDTDGIIGGRYRGRLTARGDFLRLTTPFVPDELAEAFDARTALDDLFPPLPPPGLRVGARWTDGAGLDVVREPDSVAAGRRLLRLTVRRRTETSQTVPRGDTVPVPLEQTTSEEARVVWDPRVGLVRRERRLVVDAALPAGGRVRSPVRSRVVQQAELTRVTPTAPCR